MKNTLLFLLLVSNYLFASEPLKKQTQKPNVIIILSDDQGWGDVGFNGSEIPTPNLDALAKDGVIMTQGYASHPYCSPSRAGLLSGRYQQRFGHENNIPYNNVKEDDGLPLDELLLSEHLKKQGYKTCAIGKWHLGDHESFWPINRGFDDWFGFYGGDADYWGEPKKKSEMTGVLKNGKLVPKNQLTYLTDDFTKAATDYIDSYTENEEPFFMYLAYNAPHAPIQAPQKYLKKVEHIEDGKRAAYGALVVGMDHGVGEVIKKLKEKGIYENTLIVFYSDNGPHIHGASGYPFRGHKGMLFEAGIRVPFIFSWPNELKGGQRYDQPISALDIFPTAVAATSSNEPNKKLDGVNLLPYLKGKEKAAPHKTIFWRYSDGAGYAIRHGDYKLVFSGYKQKNLLFDLAKDPYEHNDLALENPDVVEQLTALYTDWTKGTVKAKWYDPHAENVLKEEESRQYFIDKASKGEKKSKNL